MLFLNILFYIGSSTVIAIDLGSSLVKVAVGSRYNSPHTVYNSYTYKEYPNMLIVKKDHSYFVADEAMSECKESPNICYQNIPLHKANAYKSIDINGYEMMALFLHKIVQDVINKEHIYDSYKVVIAVSPTMTLREKSYLYTATQIVGLNCVQFVTSTYAPIEYYANEKTYINENHYNTYHSHKAIIVDIGHSGVRVSGFEFTKTKVDQLFGLFEDGVGGASIDKIIMDAIIEAYNFYLSDTEKEQLLFKIKEAREELSTYRTSTFYFKFKTIMLDRETIKRATYKTKDALRNMFNSINENYGKMLFNCPIQLIGGCSQIPYLQEYLSELLPDCQFFKSMDKSFSVALGACYMITSEISSSVQEHNPLVTSKYKLKTYSDDYNIFTRENKENFGPIVRLNYVESYRDYDIAEGDNVFLRFSIDVPSYMSSSNNVADVAFSLNYYLMPVVDEVSLIRSYGESKVDVSYTDMKWQVSKSELKASFDYVKKIIERRSKKSTKSSSNTFNDAFDIFSKGLKDIFQNVL